MHGVQSKEGLLFNQLIQFIRYTEPNIPNDTKPSLTNLICTLGTKPNLFNQVNEIKSNQKAYTEFTNSNLFNLTYKVNPPKQFYETKYRETKCTEKVNFNSIFCCAWPSSVPAYFLSFHSLGFSFGNFLTNLYT